MTICERLPNCRVTAVRMNEILTTSGMLIVVKVSLSHPTDKLRSNLYHFLSMQETVPLPLNTMFSFLLYSLKNLRPKIGTSALLMLLTVHCQERHFSGEFFGHFAHFSMTIIVRDVRALCCQKCNFELINQHTIKIFTCKCMVLSVQEWLSNHFLLHLDSSRSRDKLAGKGLVITMGQPRLEIAPSLWYSE